MDKIKGRYIAGRDITILKRLKHIGSQVSFWVGLGITLLILLLSLFLPCPTASQFQLFRIALAIGIASFTGSLPGFFKIAPNVVVKVGTGLAVFLICYFTNPATIVIKDDCMDKQVLYGKVIYSNTPLANVRVNAGLLNEGDFTNSAGEFDIPYYGELELPLNLHFRFAGIDTVWQIETLPEGEPIVLNLRDTIPGLTKSHARDLLMAYLKNFEKEIKGEHKRLLYRNTGRKSSLDEVSKKYGHFDKINASYRNPVSFTNGFTTLTSQKGLRVAGIQIDPMVPYHAYGLLDYEVFLYNDTLWSEKDKSAILLSFGFFNSKPIKIEIASYKRRERLEYRLGANFEENIRYISTSVQCTKSNNWVKFQKTAYEGMRPFEEFVIRYIDSRWQLFDTRN